MKRIPWALLPLLLFIRFSGSCTVHADDSIARLQDSLEAIAAGYEGEIGIALITSRGDTLVVNNETKYPLMSVFKLHQAIALCDKFARSGTPLDTVVEIDTRTLNSATWSPMLRDHKEPVIVIPVSALMRYTIMQSDNNASNYMFDNLCSVEETDSFIASLIPRGSFRISVTEADMWSNHDLAYENCSSPLGAASLICRLFTDSVLCAEHSGFIRGALLECSTGADRIAAAFGDDDSVDVAHKTGSGFTNAQGVLCACNDVAVIMLPDGSRYALAVFIKDFHGPESIAAEAIARISAAVRDVMARY